MTFPAHLLLILSSTDLMRNLTFGGDIVTNSNDNYILINEWDGHESRLLFAGKIFLLLN